MLEIPQRIWKRIKGYTKPQRVYRTNHENVLCWQTVRRVDRKKAVIKLFEWDIVEETNAELRAAETLIKINHPNLVKVLEVKEDEELGVYYVMEYWGEDLRETVKTPPRQDWVIEVIKQLLEGVAELHKHKLVHRDIKPENIFIKGNQVKLGDYGLVKSKRWITQLSTAGTPGYMPPEPRNDRDLRWDIYSVGVVLLELLTSRRELPTEKSDDISDNLWQVILKATAKEPDERFSSADVFIRTLSKRNLKVAATSNSKGRRRLQPALSPDKRPDKIGAATTKTKDLLSPISQNLDIWRRTPGTKRTGEIVHLGILVKTLQAQFDELIETDDTKRALEVGGELLKAVEQRFGPKDPHTADVLDALAELNLRKGDYRAAWELYHRSLAIDTDTFGRPSREVVRSLFNEAEVLFKEGTFEEATQTYQQTLQTAEKVIGKDQPQMAAILNNLAGAYYGRKDYAKAQEFYQQALRINEQKFGRTHESVAINLYNLALVYKAMGNEPTARSLHQRAVEIGEKVFKPDDERLDTIKRGLQNT